MVIKNKYQNKRAYIVIGLGFGDEGKGLTTDYLCQHSTAPLVVRFNGGQQAGHTVVRDDSTRHVFSNFGSGTLNGVPTYWSKYCTFSPVHFLEEYKQLAVQPKIYIDNNASITTHYDILFNRAAETSRGGFRHGSCGVGFGATIERTKDVSIMFNVNELTNRELCIQKLKSIREYYAHKFKYETIFDFNKFDHNKEDENFLEDVLEINKLLIDKVVEFVDENEIFKNQQWLTYIFEGAQGILLDIDFGIKPHVTKSNTTSKNAIEMLHQHFEVDELYIEIYYVSRSYLTRHGEGPFDRSFGIPVLQNTEFETNVENGFQGKFRTAFLNLNLLHKALNYDNHFTQHLSKNLLITCMDQLITSQIPIIIEEKLVFVNYEGLQNHFKIDFKSFKLSYGPRAIDIREVM